MQRTQRWRPFGFGVLLKACLFQIGILAFPLNMFDVVGFSFPSSAPLLCGPSLDTVRSFVPPSDWKGPSTRSSDYPSCCDPLWSNRTCLLPPCFLEYSWPILRGKSTRNAYSESLGHIEKEYHRGNIWTPCITTAVPKSRTNLLVISLGVRE